MICTYLRMLFVLDRRGSQTEGIMGTCRERTFPVLRLFQPMKIIIPVILPTAAILIGNEDALALPIPLLPYIPEGAKDDIFPPLSSKSKPEGL